MDAPRCDAQRSQKGSEAAFARQEVVRMMVAWLFTFLLAVIAENAEEPFRDQSVPLVFLAV